MREFLLQYILPPQQSVKAHAESVGYGDYFDISHEAFAALDALDGVFVYIKSGKLECIGELALREWYSNPRYVTVRRFSRPLRYNHFGISP